MSKRIMPLIVGAFALLICASLAFGAAAEKDKVAGVAKTTQNDDYKTFTINSIFNYYSNNGDGSYNKFTGNAGLEWPAGSNETAIFEDGVVWGGFHKGRAVPKVGGSVYRHALQAGRLLTPGTAGSDPTADDPGLAKYRVFRVRPDVGPKSDFADEGLQKSLQREAELISRNETATPRTIYDAYIKDWNEWPAKTAADPSGLAPFTDVNGNGTYEPSVDIPGQPGADQTLYYVGNDMNASRTQNLAGCPPIGLEVHRTFWGYNRQGALGQTIFSSTVIINKSGAPLDSAFFVQWADPDLGDSGDDFVGCDTTRSLGYVYNGKATDNTYGADVPAAGYDFFQGPIVKGAASDSAVFHLAYRHGFKNLGMSTFVFFSQGFPEYADPAQGADGDRQWYRLMNGLTAAGGNPFINPVTKQPTKFTLSGDPVGGGGWVDGMAGLTPQDRRMCLVSGPFTLADKDTQELVVATIVGLGGDRISSIAVLKYYDDLAQSAYNNLFRIPNPPPAPKVDVATLNGHITLNWGDPATYKPIEAWNSLGYKFEGYNVYQLPTSAFDRTTAKRLATYDIAGDLIATVFDDEYDPATGYIVKKPVLFGSDAGIQRAYSTTTDAIGARGLINGTTYHFAVTAYSVNLDPTAKPTYLESSPQVLNIVPQWDIPGTRLAAAFGDTLAGVTHTGPSNGAIYPVVVNPQTMKKEGAAYKVVFHGFNPTQTWSLVRTWNGRVDTVVSHEANQTGDDTSPIVDGIQWRVIGAPLDFKAFLTISNKNGPINPPQQGTFAFNSNGFPLTPDGADRPDGTKQQSTGLTASSGWGIATGMNAPDMDASYEYFKTRVTQGGARWSSIIPYDWEIRFTAAGGKGIIADAFTGAPENIIADVPFELWNIGIATPNDPSDDYRLMPLILDVDGNGAFNILTKAGTDSVDNGGGGPDHTLSGGDNDPETDWFYWAKPTNTAPGQAGYNEILAAAQADPQWYLGSPGSTADVMRRMVFVGWNIGSASAANAPANYLSRMPETGTTFRILTTKPNQPSDVFTVNAPALAQNSALAKADADRVNVFPNPYIGFNPQEQNKYQRFVTFTHMPAKAILRVFNLAGVLIRTLRKEDPSQFFQWDLRNEDGFPVSAGMYVVYIDMPEVGKTKTLKLGVIPEQQFIDRW